MDYKLLQAIGIELEYMIVSRCDLQILPISNFLLRDNQSKCIRAYTEHGRIEWSNELAAHIIEIKNAKPEHKADLSLAREMHCNVKKINELLKSKDAMLLPSSMHPFMEPKREAVLWQHENRQIYSLYDKIFDCRRHGWVNLQSCHINLSFCGDEEFKRLHAAIRLILPLIPALTASSPIYNSKLSEFLDSRLIEYRHNQEKIPAIAGDIIPEPIYSEADYEKQIFSPISTAIAEYDKDKIFNKYFLNSRGAIARFDRGSIEIRLADTQENPFADFATTQLITAVIHTQCQEKWIDLHKQQNFPSAKLVNILDKCIREGENAIINDTDFLSLFQLKESMNAGEIWRTLAEKTEHMIHNDFQKLLDIIFKYGTLATRIKNALQNSELSRFTLLQVYNQLAHCLNEATPFIC